MDLIERKRSLEQQLARLQSRVSKIESELRGPQSPDWADRASESENQEVLERLNEAERDEIRAIGLALERIGEGTYEICLSCGAPIADARLDTLPYATQCVSCAEAQS